MRTRPAAPNSAAPLRAVVTDIDGTLTDAHRRLSPEIVADLQALEQRGIPVVLATGNVLPIALAFHRSLGLSAPIVAENGGIVYHRSNAGEVVERLADRRVAWAAYRRLRARGLPVHRLFTDRWRETEVALEANVPVARIRRNLDDLPVDVEATGYALHLMERGGGKHAGLARALALLGVRLADCLVAGDGDNDVRMLRGAGLGVSFPTGSPRARAAADLLARRPYSSGLDEVLKRREVVSRLLPLEKPR